MPSYRRDKEEIGKILKKGALNELLKFRPRILFNYLLPYLYSDSLELKWAAIKGIGLIASKISENDMEYLRILMRRFMWNLNDESGGIGWGSPEAMGEIMASVDTIREEFTNILISYLMEDGNYLEEERLRQGVIWAIGRIAKIDPSAVKDASIYILKEMEGSNDLLTKALCIWVCGLLSIKRACKKIREMEDSNQTVEIFDDRLRVTTIADLCKEAAERIGC